MAINIGSSELLDAYVGPVDDRQPTANTIAYYPLTKESALLDKSGNNHNLTQNGTGISYSQDYDSIALSNYSFLSTANFDNMQHDWTFSTYFRQTAYNSGNGNDLFSMGSASNYRGIFLGILTGEATNQPRGGVQFAFYGNDYLSSGGLVDLNKWYNITYTYTYNSRQGKVYLNGTLILTCTFNSQLNLGANTLYIGAAYLNVATGASQYKFTGNISRYIFETGAWTQDEITKYVNKTKGKYGLS